MTEVETFERFLERNPEFKPIPGELMTSVYRKQVAAFGKFADEQVCGLRRLRADVDELKRFLVL